MARKQKREPKQTEPFVLRQLPDGRWRITDRESKSRGTWPKEDKKKAEAHLAELQKPHA